MSVTTPQPLLRTEIGSWIPFVEIRPDLWLAEHAEVGGQVFLAVFAGLADNRPARSRVLEHNHLSRSGPGIAKVIEAFINGADLLAAIECAGQPFDAPGRSRGAEEILAIGVDIGRALARLHAAGRVHGMLWAGSILSGRRGSGAVLLDLGWCAAIGTDASAVSGWSSIAPENIGGAPLSRQTDVWGLGTLLHSLATGQFWDSRTVADLGGIEPKLASVIRACLEVDPARRPQTVLDVVAALEAPGPMPAFEPEPVAFAPVAFAPEPEPELIDATPLIIEIEEPEYRLSRAEAIEAWGEHADWFIEDGDELTEDQRVGLFGYRPPLSSAARVALTVATTGVALASVMGLAVLGAEALG